MRFRLVDLLAHGRITYSSDGMRGRHRFTDTKGLISAASDELFKENRDRFINNVAGLYQMDPKLVTAKLQDVERSWVASRISILDDHDKWLTKRTYITSGNICDVRVLLQRPKQQTSPIKELLWEVCPDHQIPADFTVDRLVKLLQENQLKYDSAGIDYSF
jgi:hypothetical protein